MNQSLLDDSAKGYADARTEEILTIHTDISDNVVRTLTSTRHGTLFRVANRDGFRITSEPPHQRLEDTPFSDYVREIWREALQSDGSSMTTEGLPTDLSQHVKRAMDLHRPGLEFRFLRESRNVRFGNVLGVTRLRTDRVYSARIDLRTSLSSGILHLRRFIPNPTLEALEETCDNLWALSETLRTARPLSKQDPVTILHPSVAAVLAHETYGHASEWDLVPDESRVTTGEMVASSRVTLEDLPHVAQSAASLPFDDEGLPTENVRLIEDGVLKSGFCGMQTAYRLGLKPSGASRARDFRYPPISRMTNIRFAPGKKSVADLFKEITDGIYLIGSLGGQLTRDAFIIQCQYGYRVRRGELCEPILAPCLSGNRLTVLQNVREVADDFVWLPEGGCLRDNQFLHNSGRGSPHIVIDPGQVG